MALYVQLVRTQDGSTFTEIAGWSLGDDSWGWNRWQNGPFPIIDTPPSGWNTYYLRALDYWGDGYLIQDTEIFVYVAKK